VGLSSESEVFEALTDFAKLENCMAVNLKVFEPSVSQF